MASFRQDVINYVKKIPAGKVATYKSIANHFGKSAYRAVGRIMAANNDPKCQCYKVIKSNGEVGRYSTFGGNKEKIETTAFHSSHENLRFSGHQKSLISACMMGGRSGICVAQKPSSRGMLSVKNHIMPPVCDWWFLTFLFFFLEKFKYI